MLEVKGQLNALGVAQQIKPVSASNVSYNNTTSGLIADDVQEAIDELASRCDVYSTDERVVGTWIDGSTVYERVMDVATTIQPETPTLSSDSIDGINKIIEGSAISPSGSCFLCIIIGIGTGNKILLINTRKESSIDVKYIVIRYTKTLS